MTSRQGTSPETRGFARYLSRLGGELDAFLGASRTDPVQRAESWSAALRGPVPHVGVGAEAVMDELAEVLIPNGSRFSEPGFWGFITCGPTTMPTVASTAAAIASPQRYTVTAFNQVETLSLEWLAELCHIPATMQGVYVSGGSVANLVALGAARQWAFERAGHDVGADGLDGRPASIYASTEVHHTIQRSASVLGLGRSSVVQVATDGRQRIDPDALDAAMRTGAAQGRLPVAVIGTAGTTNTGAIDPLRRVGEIAHAHGAWFHLDGAYGLPGILDERVADAYDGLELADSIIVDPHKWLGVPVGTAAAYVRDGALLHRTFTQGHADYLEGSFVATDDDVHASMDALGGPWADLAVELSSPSRGVAVWAALREIGVEGMRARVAADIDLARRVTESARRHPRLEALTEPQLSIACIRYVDDAGDAGSLDGLNQRLLRRLQRETPYQPSATLVGGRFAIRPCFINARTRPEHVEGFLDTLVALGDDLRDHVTVA